MNAMSNAGCSFEAQNATPTFGKGLAEYFDDNPELVRGNALSSCDARRFFESHDAVHVVYGCGTSMPDEAVVKLSSIFGTTAGIRVLEGYRLHELLDVCGRLPIGDALRAVVCSADLVPRTIQRCRRQRQRWPWDAFEGHLNMPLGELRAMFGIIAAHRDAT